MVDTGKLKVNDSLNKVLTEQNILINDFKDIKNDILAQKVFEQSKSRLINWITFGGIILLIIAIIGYFKAISIIKTQVAAKLKEISQQQILEQIKEQSNAQVASAISLHLQNIDISLIAGKILQEGNTAILKLLTENKTQFDSFVNSKKHEIESLVKQLHEKAAAFNNPIGAVLEAKEVIHKVKLPDAPAKIDYTDQMLPVRDGGPEGGVVGFAVAACMEYQIFKQYQQKIMISPRQIYYYARLKGGMNLKQDTGAFIKDGINAAKDPGTIEEKDWPYVPGEFNKKPPASEIKFTYYKLLKAIPIRNIKAIKEAIFEYGPITIGITMYESTYTENKHKIKGMISMPKEGENIMGGHAICLVGYDDEKELFKFRNNWGKKWGDKGYGYLPYEYIKKFSDDGWALEGIEIQPGDKI